MSNFNSMLAHVTGGRRYCFVIMTYHEGYAFFERICKIVAEETGLECIRADDIPGAGEDLRGKIHAAIDQAVCVIADVSHLRPNIYYEVGYSVARNKPMLLLAREDVQIPTDLLGVELIRYADNREGAAHFEKALRRHLAVHADSNVSLLRSMILPQNPHPSFIVVNPKPAGAHSRFQSHPYERKTYGDYLGVIGILGAFASVYGEHIAPDLITASRAPQDLMQWDANIYLIGSPKVNDFTGHCLEAIQKGRAPNWRLHRCDHEENVQDYKVHLSGNPKTGEFSTPCERDVPRDKDKYEDYGLVIRGPHPRHPHRMVTILAGPHSMGTGAACLAATRTELIRKIDQRLAGTVDLTMRDKPIWILVKGAGGKDGHIDQEGVEIVNAGTY